MRASHFRFIYAVLFALLFLISVAAVADEPKPTPQNTISIQPATEVRPQTFPRPIKFYIEKVIDRSSNPQPLLVWKPRGGVFLDRQPTEIVQQAFQQTLEKTGLLATDRSSADYALTVYVFHFGLASGTGMEFFGKVDLNIVVKDVASGKSQTVTALGTSIQGGAVRKKNILKNIEAPRGWRAARSVG